MFELQQELRLLKLKKYETISIRLKNMDSLMKLACFNAPVSDHVSFCIVNLSLHCDKCDVLRRI